MSLLYAAGHSVPSVSPVLQHGLSCTATCRIQCAKCLLPVLQQWAQTRQTKSTASISEFLESWALELKFFTRKVKVLTRLPWKWTGPDIHTCKKRKNLHSLNYWPTKLVPILAQFTTFSNLQQNSVNALCYQHWSCRTLILAQVLKASVQVSPVHFKW